MVGKNAIPNTDAIMVDKETAEAPKKDASGSESICLDDYLIPGDPRSWDVEYCYVLEEEEVA